MATTTALRSRDGLAGTPGRVFEADLSQPLPFALLSAVFLIVRLPFLNYGHGTDPDAWRVAMTGHYLWDHAKYFPSRLPGNPLHELVMALFVPAGWIGANLATALAALLGVWLFARIVSHLQVPSPGVLVIGFAFMPLLFINSIATMDYMWTLTLLLGAYYSVLKRSPLLAGLLLGCAIGFRLQSFIVWPVFAYLLWRQGRLRSVAPFSLAAGGVAALAFSPVLAVYGLDFWNFYDASVGYQDVLRLLGKEALGVLGSLGVLAGAAISLPRLRHLPADVRKDPQVAAWVGLIFIYFASFSRLPHEIAYLIPVFPFGLLIMGRYFTRPALYGAIAAILIAGLVDVTTPGDGLSLSDARQANIGKGLLLSNAQTMNTQKDFVREIMDSPVPDHSVVISGFVFPQLAVRERDRLESKIIERDYGAISMLSDRGEAVDEVHDIRYVWLLTYDTFQALRSQGYNMFLVPDAAGGTAALYDYRPTIFGATFLKLERPSPSAGKGTASTDR